MRWWVVSRLLRRSMSFLVRYGREVERKEKDRQTGRQLLRGLDVFVRNGRNAFHEVCPLPSARRRGALLPLWLGDCEAGPTTAVHCSPWHRCCDPRASRPWRSPPPLRSLSLRTAYAEAAQPAIGGSRCHNIWSHCGRVVVYLATGGRQATELHTVLTVSALQTVLGACGDSANHDETQRRDRPPGTESARGISASACRSARPSMWALMLVREVTTVSSPHSCRGQLARPAMAGHAMPAPAYPTGDIDPPPAAYSNASSPLTCGYIGTIQLGTTVQMLVNATGYGALQSSAASSRARATERVLSLAGCPV